MRACHQCDDTYKRLFVKVHFCTLSYIKSATKQNKKPPVAVPEHTQKCRSGSAVWIAIYFILHRFHYMLSCNPVATT